MLPEDSVLVGVINRKRDFTFARDQHWYRIPQAKMARGVTADYIAFFTSGKSFGERSGGIHYYAENVGLELHYRRELIPDQPDHPRANETYYRVALGDLQRKEPPVTNPTNRSISFIYTTWDRFIGAETIADLFNPDDYYVDRIYYALRNRGLKADRSWSAERKSDQLAPGLRILCDNGSSVVASTRADGGVYFMDQSQDDDTILQAILAQIASNGGPAMLSIPPNE